MTPLLTVCIPAYNRAEVLGPLLDSILTQDYSNYEILVCEDNSPGRPAIHAIIQKYQDQHPKKIVYFENETTLGYDGNIRNLIERARGTYCFFMGNDDLMAPQALSTVAGALQENPDIGVILRSYATFTESPDKLEEVFRYFESPALFPSGADTIATFYRRSVVIPGVVLHREESLKWRTERFDGILLYQLYLVANILVTMNGYFLPNILAYYRKGGIPDFGNSKKEKQFVPGQQTPESSVYFMRGMLDIARYVQQTRNIAIYKPILRDIANYSYPILAIQACQPFLRFVKYYFSLCQLGLGRNLLFHAYFYSILILGTNRLGKLIQFIKVRLGHTPTLGSISKGIRVTK